MSEITKGSKMNKNKSILILGLMIGIVGLFLIINLMGLASASTQSLGTFKKGTNVSLMQNCVNSTYANITMVLYPNSSSVLNGQIDMTLVTDNDYRYGFGLTEEIGKYVVYGSCDENGVKTNWVYDFEITSSGYTPTIPQGIILIMLLIISGIFAFFSKAIDDRHFFLKIIFLISTFITILATLNVAKDFLSDVGSVLSISIVYQVVLWITILIFIYYSVMFIIDYLDLKKQNQEDEYNM